MRRVCRLAVYLSALCALIPNLSKIQAQSWSAPTAYPASVDASTAIVTADMLGNNTSDVLAVTAAHNLDLFENDGAGHLGTAQPILSGQVTAVTAAKFTGSTMDDLLVVEEASPNSPLQLMLLPSVGARAFGTSTAIAPGLPLSSSCQISASDFNGDGIPDILVFCPDTEFLAIGINSGAGKFIFKTVSVPTESGRTVLNVSAGDLDGDGLADIVMQSSPTYSPKDTRIDVLWNSASGTFSAQQGYVSQPDITGMYAANLAGHTSNNLTAIASTGLSVFADQTNRNSLSTFSPLQVSNGCTVAAVTSGRIAATQHERGLDIVAAATCDGQNQFLVYLNTAQTSISVTPKLSYSGGVPALSLSVNVASAAASIIPTGDVTITRGSTTVQQTLTNGNTQVDLQPAPGENSLQIVYSGDSSNAGYSEKFSVELADQSVSQKTNLQMDGPTITPVSSLAVGVPYQLQANVDFGKSSVREPVAGAVTFTDNGNPIATVQGNPSYAVSAWAPSDCSFKGSKWVGTQCDPGGSGGYQVAYEQDTTSFTASETFANPGTHSIVASFAGGKSGSVANNYTAVVNGTTGSGTSSNLTSPVLSNSNTAGAFLLDPAARLKVMAQSTSTNFGVISSNNPSNYGQQVTFATNYPAPVGMAPYDHYGTWTYYDNGQLLGTAVSNSLYEPVSIAVNSNTNYIYVANGCYFVYYAGTHTCADSVSVINGATDQIVATVQIGPTSDPSAAYALSGIAVDSSSGYVYVAYSNKVAVISAGSNSVIATLPIVAKSIAVNSNTHMVYVANGSNIQVINGTTLSTVGTLGTGGGINLLAINQNTNVLYYLGDSNTNYPVHSINLATNSVNALPSNFCSEQSGGAGTSLTVNPTTNTLYCASPNNPSGVTTFDASSGAVSAVQVAVTATGPFAVNPSNGVSCIPGTNYNTGVQSIECGVLPGNLNIAYTPYSYFGYGGNVAGYIVFNPSTNKLYIAEPTRGAVLVLDGSTYSEIDTIGMTASYTISSLGVGTHAITSHYSGDSLGDPAATSSVLSQVVNGITPSVSFTISPNPVIYGQEFLVNVQVSCNSACGDVDYRFDGGEWGTVALNGSGSFSAGRSTDPVGTHTVQVNFLGGGGYSAVTTSPQTVTILPASSPTTTAVWSSENPSPAGQAVQAYAEVFGNSSLSGSVVFTVDGNTVGTPVLSSQTVTNLLPDSGPSTWTTWGYSGYTQTLAGSAYPAPDGTMGASYFIAGGTNTSIIEPRASDGQVQGVDFTVSVWMRTDTPCTVAMGTESPTTPYEGASAPMEVTTNWQRFSFSHTYVNPGTGPVSLLLMRSPGCNIYVWGGQIEASRTAGPYVFTTGASRTATVQMASIPISGLSIGTHSFVAAYAGNQLASTSPVYSQIVTGTNSISSVTSSGSPSTYGQSVTFTNVISTGGQTPTGTVNFTSDGTPIGSGTITPVANKNLVPYSNNFNLWGTNAGVNITPNAIAGPDGSQTASLLVVGSGGGYFIGQSLFACSPGAVTDSVWMKQYSADPASIIFISVRFFDSSNNQLALIFAPFTPGSSWQRESTTNTAPAGTTSCWIGIEQSATGMGGSASPGMGVYVWGAQVEQSASPGPYIETAGTSASGFGGVATFTTSSLTVGSHTVSSAYVGDSNVNASTAPSITQVVNIATPTVTLTSSLNPSTYGQSVSFIATVPSGATGAVTFTDGGATIGTATAANGTAQFTTTALAVGTHVIVANYAGNAGYTAASSAPLSQVVNQAATSFALSSSSNPSIYGSPVTFTATGLSSVTGVLSFYDGSTQIGVGNIVGGSASISIPLLASGTHSITVKYPGNTNYMPSTSAALIQTVNTAPVAITISSTINPSDYGQTVVFTFTLKGVAGGAVPAGLVQVTDGVNALGTLTLNSSGVATFTTSTLVAGTHNITAAYQGDSNYH